MNKNKEIGWHFDNSYARLPETFFEHTNPVPVQAPELVIFNYHLATSLGLSQSEASVSVFAGNDIPKDAMPLAQAYAGHQFGHFTKLGDGRAVLLGEHITSKGERFDIQLKGAGKTPYSRGGDGRAALGPMLREYIISEAMHGLGIPTTRSLAVVTTGEAIMRETKLPGAILTRVAASHLRVGTFQYVANWRPVEELRVLADYTIKRHFPDVANDEKPYLSLYEKVMERQAELIAKWQLVGFIHGVMNTDNMALSGETIDYGPCAFMDAYDPETVFSSIDHQGRYAYKNQPLIAGWNLARFAETLLPLFHDDMEKSVELAEERLSHFHSLFHSRWLAGMRAKLGIFNEEAEDQVLIDDLLAMMEKYQADYTNTFLALTFDNIEDTELCLSPQFREWRGRWDERLGRQREAKSASVELMKKTNPALIPRNHRVEEALEAAVKHGDDSVMRKLLDVLSNPYAHSNKQAEYAIVPDSTWPYQTFCGT